MNSMSPHLTLAIVIHLTAALFAVGLGTVVLILRKGTRTRRWLGRTWAGTMLVVAIGSFWLRHTGGLSWIHGLSAFTLCSLTLAVWAIRRGRVRLHRRAMLGTFAGLAIAGVFAFSPGRLLGQWVIGW
jgi:uncharacterized membrane protein